MPRISRSSPRGCRMRSRQVKDLVWLPKSRRFAALFNRFKWEDGAEARSANLRVRSRLHFDDVLSVQVDRTQARRAGRGRRRCSRSASRRRAAKIRAATVELVFAGGGAIRLEVECIDAGAHRCQRRMGGARPSRPRDETLTWRAGSMRARRISQAQFDALLFAKREIGGGRRGAGARHHRRRARARRRGADRTTPQRFDGAS